MLYRLKLNSATFTWLLAIYFILIINANFIHKISSALSALETVKPGLYFAIIILMIAIFNIIFSLMTIKYIEKILIGILLFISPIVAYQSYYYGVVFDKDMIANIFETHTGEIASFVNYHIFMWVCVLGIIPIVIMAKTHIIHKNFAREIFVKLKSALVSVAIIAVISMVYYKDIASIARNNETLRQDIIPTYVLSSLYKYMDKSYFSKPKEHQTLGLDAKIALNPLRTKNNLLVLVVGETARSMNQQLNGYHKDTNAHTQKYNLISFKKVSSCGTATAISVPCMFSRLPRQEYDGHIAKYQDNLLDVLKRADLNVLWLDNDDGCKGVCDRVEHKKFKTKKSKFCDGLYCVDEVLLDGLQARLDSLPQKDTVIVLHIIGSHGPTYYRRYPENHRRYLPDCQRSDIQNCTKEQLINTYDNTIAYTDYILSQTIKLLSDNGPKWNTAMLYVSDHGESLGEYGLYLHGAPYFMAPSEQTQVPMMVWLSDSFTKQNHSDIAKIKNRAETGVYSHDNLFDSVLGLMNVKTVAYNNDLDIFNKYS